MSELDKVIYEASKADRGHTKRAGRAVGETLDKHNTQVKKKRDQHFERELGEITRYHEDRVMKNKTYHF